MSLKAALLFALLLAPGCGLLAPQGPTDVARGEYYAAGRPEFDAFFIDLHRQQVASLAAPNEPQVARKNLTQALGLTPDASNDSLGLRLAQEAQKLASRGLRLRLEIPEPSSSLDASAILYASETTTASPLRALLPEEATRLVRSRNRALTAKAELDKLRLAGLSLEGSVDQAFRTEGPWKRSEVRDNLSDGQKLITLMQARAQDVVEQDTRLLQLLAKVTATDSSLGKSSPSPETSEDVGKGARRPGPARPAANGVSSAPRTTKPKAATPALPKRGGDDEAARPKPVQGSAPAEIEP